MDKQFEELITCAVCLDRYKQPKILPCQHTFCLKPCLQKLVIEKSIRCPQCRSTHKVPKNGISALPNNLTMVAILELPGKKSPKIEEACQECLKEHCAPKKCSHCEKKLCSSCTQVHSQQLVQSLSRSINQLKRLLPKLSDMISDLEDKQVKSNTLAVVVKSDVDQAIDHCVAKLKARQKDLHEQIDSFVATEIHQLRIEQENMEMEMAMVNSHCDTVEKKCKLFSESENPDVLTPSEASLLTQQCNEHLRNLKLISTNIEDKISHNIKFRNEGERSLLSAVGSFGEITVNVPSRLSFSLGSDPDINDVEIHRALHAPHGRRRTEVAESYVPSFSVPHIESSVVPGYASSPSNGSHSPRDSIGDASNPNQRSFANLPVPGASLQPHRMPRPRRTSYRLQAPDNARIMAGGNDLTQSGDSPALVQYASIRGTLWQYRSKGPVKSWFGEKGSDVGCLNWPRGIAVSSNDRIVVADSSNHRIHLFESNGEAAFTFGSYGSDEGEFDCLSGVHVTAQGWVITTDRYNHRVQIFDSMGRFIRMFGQEGSGEGDLSYPWGVATDNMGFVYVCDKDNHRIQIFTLDGQFIRKFGRIGSCDSQFDSPHYLAVTNDNKVVVSDSGNHRIQVFDKYGRFLLKFGREGSADGLLKYPRGVAVDRHGNIVVGDSGNNRVQVYTSDGTYVAGFGSWGPAPGQMKGIEGIALLSNNDIAVSDRENHRIQIF